MKGHTLAGEWMEYGLGESVRGMGGEEEKGTGIDK